MERLVVGVDGIESARTALRWALALAEALRPSQRPVREADLLVLGSSHLDRVSGAVLGPVAQRCIAEATVPVVVVPHTDGA